MAGQRFETRIASDDRMDAHVEVPAEAVEALGAGKRPPVRVWLNGHVHQNRIAVYGGRYYLGLRKEVREGTGLRPGDRVSVEITVEEEPRAVEVPEALSAALAADPDAAAAFERLSFTGRKEYAAWISQARREETRDRRLAQAVEMLKAGRRTPTGR